MYELYLDSPSGNPTWYKGQTYDIKWRSSSNVYTIDIELWKGPNPLGADIAENVNSDGNMNGDKYSWTVPNNLDDGDDYSIRLYCYCSGERLKVKGYLKIDTKMSMTITQPTSTSKWSAGSSHNINWNYEGSTGSASITLLKNEEQVSVLEASISHSRDSWTWNIDPNLEPDTDYKIRMFDKRQTPGPVYYYSAQFEITEGDGGATTTTTSEPTITCEFTKYEKDVMGNAKDISVEGNFAYVTTEENGVAIIDISDYTNPGDPSYVKVNGSATGVFVLNNYLYVASMYGWNVGNLAIIDVTDPTNPITKSSISIPNGAKKVFVSSHYAYIAQHLDFGWAIVDVLDPSNPGTPYIGSWGYEPSSIFVVNDVNLYLTDPLMSSYGLHVFVVDPSKPGEYTDSYKVDIDTAQDVYVTDKYGYVASQRDGLIIVDVANLATIGTPIVHDLEGEAFGVFINGNTAYVALRGTHLMAVVDITDSTSPGETVYMDGGGNWGNEIIFKNDNIYIAGETSGLVIANYGCTTIGGTNGNGGIGSEPTGTNNKSEGINGLPFFTLIPFIIWILPVIFLKKIKK